jgi:hypothetical protein
MAETFPKYLWSLVCTSLGFFPEHSLEAIKKNSFIFTIAMDKSLQRVYKKAGTNN